MDVRFTLHKPLRIAFYYAISFVCYYIWFQAFYNLLVYKKIYPYISFEDMIFNGILPNFTAILLVFIINTAIVFLNTRFHNPIVKFFVDSAYSISALFLLNTIVNLTSNRHIDFAGTMLNNVMVLLINEVGYYIISLKNTMKKVEEMNKLTLQLKYNILKAQVNPHLLFNSLNILSSLIYIDRDKSYNFVIVLAKMYRYILIHQSQPRVTLEKELQFMKHYISVLQMRFVDVLEVKIEGEENIMNHQILPYTTQLLIENVTKHNTISSRHPMIINVKLMADSFTISNPIVPRDASHSSGVGLRYITQLYSLQGKNVIINNDGKTFTVIIPYL